MEQGRVGCYGMRVLGGSDVVARSDVVEWEE